MWVEWLKASNAQLLGQYLIDELRSFTSNSENLDNLFTLLNESKKFAKLMLMVFDTNKEAIYKNATELLTECLVTCNRYIYMSADKIEKFLFIFGLMLQHVNSKKQKL
jgi:hypothetical protein